MVKNLKTDVQKYIDKNEQDNTLQKNRKIKKKIIIDIGNRFVKELDKGLKNVQAQ